MKTDPIKHVKLIKQNEKFKLEKKYKIINL